MAESRSVGNGVVLEIGDSLGEDLGWGMPGALASTGDKFVGAAVGDTGLAEPSYYNWAVHLGALLDEYRPKVVVVFLGANDVESYYVNNAFEPFGSHAWAQVYGLRVARIMEEATAAGAKVLWVGMPPMASPSLSSGMQSINAVFSSEASAHGPAVQYLSTWDVLGGPVGQFVASRGSVPLRAPDGTHITTQGAAIVAGAVVAKLEALGWA